jgi:hypothetical protein
MDRHHARTRPQRVQLTADAHRLSHYWEVVCEECGDDAGPVDRQSARVQDLRGPYPTFAAALLAVTQHERETRVPFAGGSLRDRRAARRRIP